MMRLLVGETMDLPVPPPSFRGLLGATALPDPIAPPVGVSMEGDLRSRELMGVCALSKWSTHAFWRVCVPSSNLLEALGGQRLNGYARLDSCIVRLRCSELDNRIDLHVGRSIDRSRRGLPAPGHMHASRPSSIVRRAVLRDRLRLQTTPIRSLKISTTEPLFDLTCG